MYAVGAEKATQATSTARIRKHTLHVLCSRNNDAKSRLVHLILLANILVMRVDEIEAVLTRLTTVRPTAWSLSPASIPQASKPP